MSTLSVGIIQSQTVSPPVIRNSIGTEIGTFCRAWCTFKGLAPNPSSTMVGFNVSSITDIAVGRWTVNFTTAMVDDNYSFYVNGRNPGSSGGMGWGNPTVLSPPSPASLQVCYTQSGNYTDLDLVTVGVFR